MFSNTSDYDVTEYIYLDKTRMEKAKWNGCSAILNYLPTMKCTEEKLVQKYTEKWQALNCLYFQEKTKNKIWIKYLSSCPSAHTSIIWQTCQWITHWKKFQFLKNSLQQTLQPYNKREPENVASSYYVKIVKSSNDHDSDTDIPKLLILNSSWKIDLEH